MYESSSRKSLRGLQDISSGEGGILLAGASLTYNLWDGDIEWIEGESNSSLLFHSGISSLCMPSRDIAIASSYEGYLHYITKKEKIFENQVAAHDSPILSIDYSYTTQCLVSASMDGKIKLWSLNHLENPYIQYQSDYNEQRRAVTAVSYRPSEKQFISVGENANLMLWDENETNPVAQVSQNYCSFSVAWSSHNNHVFLAGREDGAVQVIDIRKIDEIITEKRLHTDAVWSLSSSGDNFLSGSDDGTCCVWKLSENLESLYRTQASDAFVRAVAWDFSGKNIFYTGDWNGNFSTYKLSSQEAMEV